MVIAGPGRSSMLVSVWRWAKRGWDALHIVVFLFTLVTVVGAVITLILPPVTDLLGWPRDRLLSLLGTLFVVVVLGLGIGTWTAHHGSPGLGAAPVGNPRWREFKVWSSLISAALLIPMLATIAFSRILQDDSTGVAKVGGLFISGPRPTQIRTYAINAVVQYSSSNEVQVFGPAQMLKLTFTLDDNVPQDSAGIILVFVKGEDLRRYKEVRFLVRGEQGAEVLGVKAKDARGKEISVPLEGKDYRANGHITTSWEEVIVPFEQFRNIDLGFFDTMSLYVDGGMLKPPAETIYVGDFRFR